MLFPSLLVGYFLENPKSLKKQVILLIGASMMTVGFAGFLSIVTVYSKRSEIKLDANTYYKITANLYGTYAALKQSPLFGVALPRGDDQSFAIQKQSKRLIEEGRRELGPVVKHDKILRLQATNHNLFAFYLRHYGLVGFTLLVLMLFRIYKKIIAKQELQDRYMLLGVFVFFLQYSLLHNTQIFETLIIWILLSHGQENARIVSTPVRV